MLLLPLSLMVLILYAPRAAAAPNDNRPNVLFIAVDDLNDWIGALDGHPQTHTPNMDRLAKRGMLFTNAHCAAPACKPSRVAVMSGLRPSTTGVYYNYQVWRPVMPEVVTLNEYFMQQGYHVAGGGKIYHGAEFEPHRWHETFDQPSDPEPVDRPDTVLRWGPIDVDDKQMGDAKVVDWAIGQLNQQRDKPLFLACGIYRPHLPWHAPRAYFDRFPIDKVKTPTVKEDDLEDVSAIGRAFAYSNAWNDLIPPNEDYTRSTHARMIQRGQWRDAVQAYLASIAFADAQIGRLIDALDQSHYANNTIIVLWSDHGWHLGEKHHWRKFSLWERATRTPMMVIAPGVTKARQTCDQPVELIDLYPTLIDLCGLPGKAELQGVSVRPLLTDPVNARREQPALTTQGRGNHAVRDARYRYIRYRDGSEELYDHATDPNEWRNLADDPQFEDIKNQLRRWLPETDAADAPTHPYYHRKSG